MNMFRQALDSYKSTIVVTCIAVAHMWERCIQDQGCNGDDLGSESPLLVIYLLLMAPLSCYQRVIPYTVRRATALRRQVLCLAMVTNARNRLVPFTGVSRQL